METAAVNLAALGVDPAVTPVVTRDQVRYAKPDPDLFLAAAERLGRADRDGGGGRRRDLGHAGGGALPGARASGCSAAATATRSCARRGAIRVFEDPADLLDHIDEVGGAAARRQAPT